MGCLAFILLVVFTVPQVVAEATIVAFGDSTTATRGQLNIYAKRLAAAPTLQPFDLKIINAGVGGNNTSLASKRFDRDVLRHHADIVIIQFGINDAAVDVWRTPPATIPRISLQQFEVNLKHFITVAQSQGAQVILMTPNPMRWTSQLKTLYGKAPYAVNEPNGFNRLLVKYAASVRKLANAQQVPLVDIYQVFQDYNKQPNQSIDTLLLDGMHP
ncbi:MAG: GDSL-type esterase/lipase family protein, partial [Pirellulaceae bacterium]